jgi:hypothetical protein
MSTFRRTLLASLLLQALGLGACSGPGDVAGPGSKDQLRGSASGDGDGDESDDGDPSDEGDGESPTKTDCTSSVARANQVLDAYCASCHGPDSIGDGGFATVLDTEAMVASGLVVADDPENSPLYQRMISGSMPPKADPQPTPGDVDAVRAWIACGALAWPVFNSPGLPYTPVEERLALMADDLDALPAAERAGVRYLDITPLANTGLSIERLSEYRAALHYLMNSLSQAPEVAVLPALGENALILRVRLADFAWTAATWEAIAAGYPYAVRYDATSTQFPIDDAAAESLRTATGTSVPFMHADWFISHVSVPPLYYDILGIPATFAALEQQLGIDTAANIASGSAPRAGFRDSPLSRYNRVVERHLISAELGSLWLTYDFASNTGTSNVFLHPLDFEAVSRELLLPLPNGMSAFMIVDASGNRLDVAPISAVQDVASHDAQVHAGLSCLNCHAVDGLIGVTDEVRENFVELPSEQSDPVLALYLERARFDPLLYADGSRYQQAREAAQMGQITTRSLHILDQRYRNEMSLGDVAAVLGVEQGALEAAIDAAGDACPPRIALLRSVPDAIIGRDSFEALFDELIVAIQLGQPARAQ